MTDRITELLWKYMLSIERIEILYVRSVVFSIIIFLIKQKLSKISFKKVLFRSMNYEVLMIKTITTIKNNLLIYKINAPASLT